MKKILLSLVSGLMVTSLIAQDYTISPWFEGKGSAICLTFDDGTPDHPANAIPLLNSYDFDGTFYVNNTTDFTWHKAAIAEGHEIGNHTKNHPHLLTLSAVNLRREIGDFKKTLMAGTGHDAPTFAYPFGEGSEELPSSFEVQDSVAAHHIAGRGVYSYQITGFPYDFAPNDRYYYQLHTLSIKSPALYEMIDWCAEEGGILPLMYHGVGAPGIFENVTIEEFTEHLDYLTAKGDSVWVTTLANAIMYHRERKGAVLSEVSAPFVLENNWTLSLTDEMRDDWYYFPLSIQLTIPNGITSITEIVQDGNELEFEVEGDQVFFNAVPDGGDIEIGVLDCVQGDATLSVMGDLTFCLPDSVVFKLPYNQEYTYTWYNEGEAFGGDTNRVAVSEEGIIHAKVEWNGCPKETSKTTLNITGTCGVPITDFEIDRDVQFTDYSVSFTSTSSNLEGTETYYWDFGDGASLSPGYYGAGPVEVSYSTSGSKEVTLSVIGSVDSVSKTIVDIVQIEEYTPCSAFSQDFSDPITGEFLSGWNNYWYYQINDAIRVVTQEEGHQWHTIDYAFNNGTDETPLDFSEPLVEPVLKIRMKASDTCRIAVYLVDDKGVATVGSQVNVVGGLDVTAEYQDFVVDFSGLFFQQWEGKDVDSTNITHLRLAINPGYKDFAFTNKYGVRIDQNLVGNVDIEWVSIGRECEFIPLWGSLIIPEEICQSEPFTIKNVSKLDLQNATYTWDFYAETDTLISSITRNENEPVEFVSDSLGDFKYVILTVDDTDFGSFQLGEYINVKDCGVVGIEDKSSVGMSFQNPIVNDLIGTIESSTREEGTLSILDVNGILIYSEEISIQQGLNHIQVDANAFVNGVYLVRYLSETKSGTTKLVK